MNDRALTLPENVKLASIQDRDWNARRSIYILSHKRGDWLLLAQRIPALVHFWNTQVAADEDEKLRASSLYDCLKSNVTHKYAWNIQTVPIRDRDQAVNEFESLRQKRAFRHVCVIGSPNCYSLASA